jgi:hypothetical protein
LWASLLDIELSRQLAEPKRSKQIQNKLLKFAGWQSSLYPRDLQEEDNIVLLTRKLASNVVPISDFVLAAYDDRISSINHSCEPNCVLVRRKEVIKLVSLRPLFPNEEVTISYDILHTGEADLKKKVLHFDCKCVGCMGGKASKVLTWIHNCIRVSAETCHSCHKKCSSPEEQLQRCAKCKVVFYCGKECQSFDFKQRQHKELCKCLKRCKELQGVHRVLEISALKQADFDDVAKSLFLALNNMNPTDEAIKQLQQMDPRTFGLSS